MGGSICEGKDGGEEEGKDAGGRTREVLFAGETIKVAWGYNPKSVRSPFPNFIFVGFGVIADPSKIMPRYFSIFGEGSFTSFLVAFAFRLDLRERRG